MMGKSQMDREWTEQDLRAFVEGAQAAFETVLLDELPQDTGWQDEGLQVSYTLCNGRVSCVLHRTVRADGKLWRITMSAPLAGNLLPEERMSARERELCREDLNHDFLSGVYNRRYLETVIAAELDRWAEQGRKAAVALISLDHGAQLRDTYGQPVMDQLICFVANQWKKHFDQPAERVVCRAIDGDLAILAKHGDYCTALGMGEAHIVDAEGQRRRAACMGGMLTVLNGDVHLVATTWEWAEEIDQARAEASKKRAEEILARKDLDEREYELAQARLKRALVRTSVH